MTQTRRSFIRQGSLFTGAVAISPSLSYSANNMSSHVEKMLQKLSLLNDQQVDKLLGRQINDPDSKWNGGLKNGYDIPNAHSTSDFITKLGASYASQYSRYFLAEELEKPLEKAIQCLLNVQHEDGSIDLHSTNFHSTPDTAFIVNYQSPGYVNLKRMERPGLKGFIEKTETFFKRAGECFSTGGIHTPNHRWVVSSALARVNSFFPSKQYTERIREWLAEGIDMDPDGQYTERSVSIYSPTCDDMFLTMGRLLGRDDLLDVVRKNLDMSLYYIQPGGEVLTNASGRQDAARTGYVNGYYYSYLFFAIKDKNPEYAAVCELIANEMPERVLRYLPYLIELDHFKGGLPEPGMIPHNYFKYFKHSGVFRIRRGERDISVIERNPTFLSYMNGKAVLQSIRLSSAFYGSRGQFTALRPGIQNGNIIFNKSVTHGYFQPIPSERDPDEGVFFSPSRSGRELSEKQTMEYDIVISEDKGKLELEIEIKGVDDVPVSMELSFRPGGKLSGAVENKSLSDCYFLEEGMGEYQVGDDVIRFGPGKAGHKWAEIRGMLPKQKGISVYLTGYTPFRHTIKIG